MQPNKCHNLIDFITMDTFNDELAFKFYFQQVIRRYFAKM